MEPANRLLWFWCQRVAGGETQEKGQGTWVSIYFPGHLPKNNCMFPRKRSLSLRRERARWLPALLLLVPSSWPLLLASAGRRSCLPVSSPVTATLEMAGRAQEYEVGLCPFFYPMIFFLILCIRPVSVGCYASWRCIILYHFLEFPWEILTLSS